MKNRLKLDFESEFGLKTVVLNKSFSTGFTLVEILHVCFEVLDYVKPLTSFIHIFSANFPTVFKNDESRVVNGFNTGGPIPYQLSLTISLGQTLINAGLGNITNFTDDGDCLEPNNFCVTDFQAESDIQQ